MARYLVTGGAGFIGSNIVDELVRRGDTVTVLDNFTTGAQANLAAVTDRITLVPGDICDLSLTQKLAKEAEYILHLAALPSVPRSIADPLATNRHNVEGSLNVLWAAKEAGVKRVVVASSSSVYGESAELPKRESQVPRPISPYAVSKHAVEEYALSFHRLYGLPVVLLRYFNVFGPRQSPQSQYAAAIAKFVHGALRGGRLPIHGDGGQSRDFTFVANVVQANLLACTAAGAAGGVFNISSGRQITLLELVAMLGEIVGRQLDVEYQPARAGDVRHSLGDISAARATLGYVPTHDIRAGLEATVDYFRGLL
ncbi:MAG TPA: NAD-dependent epimerase/dehydratase family protein [bacterium]|nr:NAD-dependent epimerase/dehydratase family protein [bacterium]